MTKAEREEHLRDKVLLYSRYQSNLISIRKRIEDELNLLNQQLFDSIDEVLLSIRGAMNDKELNSLCTQFSHFLATNKKSEWPLNVVLTGVGPRLTQMLEKRNGFNWHGWLAKIDQKDYLELYEKSKLVYLTGDSENTMGNFDKNVNYIVGGLIDHNKLKNITLD